MKNCLIAKLKGVVANDNLAKLGTIEYRVEDKTRFNIKSNTDLKLVVSGGTIESTGETEYIFPANTERAINVLLNDSSTPAKVTIDNKYGLIFFGCFSPTLGYKCAVVNLSDYKFCPNLLKFSTTYNTLTYGDVDDLKKYSIERIELSYGGSDVVGDLEGFPTSLSKLIINDTNIGGQLSSLNTLINLDTLTISNCTRITGSIESLATALAPNKQNGSTLEITSTTNVPVTYNGSTFNGKKTITFDGAGSYTIS